MYISICNNIFFSSVSDECCATEFWIVYWAVNSSQHSVHTNTPAHRESQWNESSCISTELVIWHYKPLWIIQPQREAIDERRAGGGGDFKGEEALGKEEEKHRGGIVTIKPAESIVREKLCVCVCFWWYKSAFVLPCADACAPTQSSRARLCCLPLCHLPWGIILKLKQSITAGDAHDRWAQHVQNEFKHPSRLPSWTLQVGTDLSAAVGFTMHLTSWLNPPYIQYSLEFK